jgi:hypothetical protein
MSAQYREQRFDISSTPLSEPELYSRAIDHLASASACFRGLAAHRKDARWLLPVRLLDEITDRVRRLMTRGGSRLLWLPERDRR